MSLINISLKTTQDFLGEFLKHNLLGRIGYYYKHKLIND